MKLQSRILSMIVALAAAAPLAHAATVGVNVSGMNTSLTPQAMSANYTGMISFAGDANTTFALAGTSPLFGGTMGSGFTVNGSLNFLNGALNTALANSLTVTSGADVMTLGFGLPATLTSLPLNSFNLAVHVSSAVIVDGNGDGKFGTITVPAASYLFLGSGTADALGQDYTFTLFHKTVNLDDSSISAVLCNTTEGGLPTDGPAVAAPLPASAYGGFSLLAAIGAGRVWRKRRA